MSHIVSTLTSSLLRNNKSRSPAIAIFLRPTFCNVHLKLPLSLTATLSQQLYISFDSMLCGLDLSQIRVHFLIELNQMFPFVLHRLDHPVPRSVFLSKFGEPRI